MYGRPVVKSTSAMVGNFEAVMWLFLLFVAVPIVEIALFIQVGGAIGLWPTLAIVVLTAVIGTSLMRAQGLMTLGRLQNALATGQNPADPMAQGAMILVAGVLLLTPGFFTDTVGFLLLVPAIRVALIRWLSARVAASGHFTVFSTESRNSHTGDTIDVEYTVVDEDPDSSPGGSGWTRR